MTIIMTASWWLMLLAFIVQPTSATPWALLATSAASLLLPPSVRLGLGGEKDLQKDCRKQQAAAAVTSSEGFVWARDATQGYEVATTLFQTLQDQSSHCSTTVWFPLFTDTKVLKGLAQVINDNVDRLGGVTAHAESWPKTPCHAVTLSWSSKSLSSRSSCLTVDSATTSASIDAVAAAATAAVKATEAWVDNTLCRLNLCPYTASLTRAAVGLESANVDVGPIVVRSSKAAIPSSSGGAAAAALLVTTFWEGVTEIATTPEQKVATSLLIAPSIYDEHFLEFVATCDDLVEASVQVVGADVIVGRAWFHPHYCEADTRVEQSGGGGGNDNDDNASQTIIMPGHALPASMVQGFIDKTIIKTAAVAATQTKAEGRRPSLEMVARANDAVRWTPHATINLLRRSQLTAAKQVEAAAPNKKPNAVYARNVMKIIADDEHELLF